MALEHPTASVTGKDDWDWNRWQARLNENEQSTSPDDDTSVLEDGALDRLNPRRVAALERKVQALRAELDQKDRDHEFVVNHYEQLLAEKDRQLQECRSTGKTKDRRLLFSRIRTWIKGV